jgi:predicted ATP-dependent serine protease
MSKVVKRGRPSKKVVNNNATFKVNTVKMNDLSFDDSLFQPLKTKTRIDGFLSNEGGLMPGTVTVFTGDPGVGKTTVLLDMLADMQISGKKCLFVSGEMNAIDMVGYVKRFPKFGDLDILFMGDYSEVILMLY